MRLVSYRIQITHYHAEKVLFQGSSLPVLAYYLNKDTHSPLEFLYS
jgi:hypothetical protein